MAVKVWLAMLVKTLLKVEENLIIAELETNKNIRVHPEKVGMPT